MSASNTGGNSRQTRVLDDSGHDEAYAQLSAELKEFLTVYDIGGYHAGQLLDLVRQHGENRVKLVLRINRNIETYDKYGRDHPNFDPSLPYRRSR